MTVLITGATGFIGRHLTSRLLGEGAAIRVLTRESESIPQEWMGRVEILEGSLLDQYTVKKATAGISLIYHLAGESRDRTTMRAVNVEAVGTLLAAAADAGVTRIVHLSSAGVVGSSKTGVITEEIPCAPENEYEKTKFEGEQLALAFSQHSAVAVVVARPTIVFGEQATRQKDSFLGWLCAIQKNQFALVKGRTVANYIYVGDVVEAMRQLAQHPTSGSEIFNLSDPVSMEEFVAAMAKSLNVAPPSASVPKWAAYVVGASLEVANKLLGTPAPLTKARVRALSSKAWFSSDKLKSQGNFTFPYGYRCGLNRTVRWYRKMGWL